MEPIGQHTVEALTKLVSGETVIRLREPLARRTTLRVGGPADLYIEPATEQDLAEVVGFCRERGIPFFVLGRGSNLLVRDAGYRGAVLSLSSPCFSQIRVTGERLHCGAGARLKTVAFEAKRASLAGLEFLEGIPGSVGGALRMNAGAMGSAIFEVVQTVRLMNPAGGIEEWSAGEMQAEYRECAALRSRIALAAVLEARPGAREEIEARLSEFARKRWSSQPAASSAGCMFKNPPTIPAGKLIDELGLKGTRIGGAMVSREHGNFLVNDGTATAEEVLRLIELVQQRARALRGVELETEVEIIGE